jgi:hypothetical protein
MLALVAKGAKRPEQSTHYNTERSLLIFKQHTSMKNCIAYTRSLGILLLTVHLCNPFAANLLQL